MDWTWRGRKRERAIELSAIRSVLSDGSRKVMPMSLSSPGAQKKCWWGLPLFLNTSLLLWSVWFYAGKMGIDCCSSPAKHAKLMRPRHETCQLGKSDWSLLAEPECKWNARERSCGKEAKHILLLNEGSQPASGVKQRHNFHSTSSFRYLFVPFREAFSFLFTGLPQSQHLEAPISPYQRWRFWFTLGWETMRFQKGGDESFFFWNIGPAPK